MPRRPEPTAKTAARGPRRGSTNQLAAPAAGLFSGTVNPPVAEHLKRARLIEEYWIPEHRKRRESALFRKNKKLLRDDLELPCWVCRTRGGEKNGLEVHHIFESALWNAMNPRRVTRILEALAFYEDGYLATAKSRAKLVSLLAEAVNESLTTPDDVRNLVVLCQQHHRSRFTGVHMISFPIWFALAAVDPRFPLVRQDVVRAAAHLRRLDEATADLVMPTEMP